MLPEKIQTALEQYDAEKGLRRKLFGDAAPIKALRQLADKDQKNYFKIYLCFFHNLPKPEQASHDSNSVKPK